MIKVRVIEPFMDKETKKIRNTNEIFDCTDARYAEIKKFVAVVEKKPEAKKK